MKAHDKHTNAPFTKEEEKSFFQWGCCPAMAGTFESGCHTSYGNNLALFLSTSKHLSMDKQKMFENAWKYFIRTGGDGQPLFDKNGLREGYKYNILNAGIYVPTFLTIYFQRPVSYLYLKTIHQFSLETKETPETNKMTYSDFLNWMLREFNDWLNENKLNG